MQPGSWASRSGWRMLNSSLWARSVPVRFFALRKWNQVGKQLAKIAKLAVVIIDELRAAGFQVDQHVTILGRLDLKVLGLGILVPGLGTVDAGHDFLVDVHAGG